MLRSCFLGALVVLVACAACARETRPPEVATDFVVPPIGKANATPPAEPPKETTCYATLHAGTIRKSSFGCVIDEQISKHDGQLAYPCSGTGEAQATFGPQTFRGSIKAGVLELEAKTELDWPGDNCRWGTTATLSGPAGVGELAWSYHDYVVRGQACSGTCTATSVVVVRTKQQEDDGDDDDDR